MFADLETVDTKTTQLCRQVEEAISMAFVCSTSPVLRDLHVAQVEPLKGAAVLGVLVFTEGEIDSDEQNNDQQIRLALERAHGYLRAEVARAISRKRVPTLQFGLVPGNRLAKERDLDDS